MRVGERCRRCGRSRRGSGRSPAGSTCAGWRGAASVAGTAIVGRLEATRPLRQNGTFVEEGARVLRLGRSSPSNGSHSWPARDRPCARGSASICAGVIRPAWLSLWPGERQAEALDRVGDEARRAGRGRSPLERLAAGSAGRGRRDWSSARPSSSSLRRSISARDGALVADLVHQPLAPGRAALEGQRRIELVRAGVDPVAQALAAGLARTPPRAASRTSA